MSIFQAFGDVNLYDIGGIILSLFLIRAVGHLWYGPYMFQKVWLEASMREVREERSRAEVLLYGLGINLLTVIGLWLLIGAIGDQPSWMSGLIISLVAWVTFSLPVGLQTVVFEERPMRLILINSGNQLIGFILAGLIIGATAGYVPSAAAG